MIFSQVPGLSPQLCRLSEVRAGSPRVNPSALGWRYLKRLNGAHVDAQTMKVR
jgi:hypothetical protein